jgi:hypothetical protein
MMKLLQRPSFYLATVPIIVSVLAYLLHEAMGCGSQCTGTVSAPVDFVARFIMFYVGFNLVFFTGLAIVVLIVELVYAMWQKHKKIA